MMLSKARQVKKNADGHLYSGKEHRRIFDFHRLRSQQLAGEGAATATTTNKILKGTTNLRTKNSSAQR
jgi:hypothetical protein